MKAIHWLKKEAQELAVLFCYFAFNFGIFIFFKKLVLDHYHINFFGFGAAMVGALIAAKAVLVIESTALSRPFHSSAPYLKVLYDTLIYTVLALLLLYLEKLLEVAHKEGSFRLAFFTVEHDDDVYGFCAVVCSAGLSFLGYAIFAAISRHMGPGELRRFFFTTPRATG